MDSESLFTILIKSNTSKEKRVLVNLRAARAAFDKEEISQVGWIKPAMNVADGLENGNHVRRLVKIWILAC